MTDQPEALRLAEELEWQTHWKPHATELRRLHALNGELLKALKKWDSVEQHLNSEIENHSAAVYEATKLLSEAREQRNELLEALCALVLNIDAGGATLCAMKDARAAIAKATGEQT
jgi:hypothetical protein